MYFQHTNFHLELVVTSWGPRVEHLPEEFQPSGSYIPYNEFSAVFITPPKSFGNTRIITLGRRWTSCNVYWITTTCVLLLRGETCKHKRIFAVEKIARAWETKSRIDWFVSPFRESMSEADESVAETTNSWWPWPWMVWTEWRYAFDLQMTS